MPELIFSHPSIAHDLTVTTGADQIEWGYGLNHVTYPTYGGEVVQILSAYVDDLTITGTCRTYQEMEHIYAWFLSYIQTASQGKADTSPTSYDERPITMRYPYRDWTLDIQVLQLPGFRLATDVVAPTWRLVAHVVEGDEKMNAITLAASANLGKFERLNATYGTGDPASNPFSNPFPDKTKVDPEETKAALAKVGDYYGTLVKSYAAGDFGPLYGSGPVLFLNGQDSTTTQTAPKAADKNLP